MEYKYYNPRKAAILDRDGTIVERKGRYLLSKGDVHIIAYDLLRRLQDRGYILIVVTNQSAVNRGIISRDLFWEINDHIVRLYREQSILIHMTLMCPHRPEDNCTCRKPLPGMITELAKWENVNLSQSILIGDENGDVQAGCNAGVGLSILIDTNNPQQAIQKLPKDR